VSVDAVTVGEAVFEAKAHADRKRLAAVPAAPAAPVAPEPPGPRSVVLAMVKFGLVHGTEEVPVLAVQPVERPTNRKLIAALGTLFGEGAIAWDPSSRRYRLTEHGEALYGPDMRQRPFLTTR
jgi:hypothetical protein